MQRHLRQEAEYQQPSFSEAQLAEFAQLQLRLLAPDACGFVAAEQREVRVTLGHFALCFLVPRLSRLSGKCCDVGHTCPLQPLEISHNREGET